MRFDQELSPSDASEQRPLEGVRILALEQMQALPYATQLLARLGASVIKVEDPVRGEASRASQPSVADRGSVMGATFLRNNLNKKSIAIDIRSPEGRELILKLAASVDVVCENLGPGRAAKFGLGYDECRRENARLIYLAISGFGERGNSPYKTWPAYAPVVEAMSGLYGHVREPFSLPLVNPSIALGDTLAGLYGVVGLLAALRHRDALGEGQFIDIAMYDAMLAMNEVMYNFWSMGVRRNEDDVFVVSGILSTFRCSDGRVMVFVGREHQLERLAQVIGAPELVRDPRLSSRRDWFEQTDPIIRPLVEAWTSGLTKMEAARQLAQAGVSAGPCNTPEDLLVDEHVQLRRMILQVPNPAAEMEPILTAGNPVKMSRLSDGPDSYYPLLGEHTDEVLDNLLGLSEGEIARLRHAGVIGGDERAQHSI